AGDLQPAGDHAHGRRLAGAVGAEQRGNGPARNLEVEVVEGDDVGEGPAHACDLDDRLRHASTISAARRARLTPRLAGQQVPHVRTGHVVDLLERALSDLRVQVARPGDQGFLRREILAQAAELLRVFVEARLLDL